MQLIHSFQPDPDHLIDFDLRILLLSADPAPVLVDRIASLGITVDPQHEVYAALSGIIDDPRAYSLLIMDCDGFGGGESGKRVAQSLAVVQARVPVILISKEHQSQIFPQKRDAPVCLRAPLSSLSLRVGIEFALRDLLI